MRGMSLGVGVVCALAIGLPAGPAFASPPTGATTCAPAFTSYDRDAAYELADELGQTHELVDTLFAELDRNRDGYLCLKPAPITKPQPAPTFIIVDNNARGQA